MIVLGTLEASHRMFELVVKRNCVRYRKLTNAINAAELEGKKRCPVLAAELEENNKAYCSLRNISYMPIFPPFRVNVSLQPLLEYAK